MTSGSALGARMMLDTLNSSKAANSSSLFSFPTSPMMTANEYEHIKKGLSANQTVLEWGSGGSTVYFAPAVGKYYSVEHDTEWSDAVKAKIKELNLNHVDYTVVPRT